MDKVRTFTSPILYAMRTTHPLLLCLLVGALAVGCGKEEHPYTPVPPEPDPPPPSFDLDVNGMQGMQMTVGGTTYTFLDDGEFAAVYQVGGAPSSRHYIAGLAGGEAGDLMAAGRIGTLVSAGPVVSPEEFHDFMAPGPRAIAPATQGGNGVEIEFHDAAGQLWSTRCGSAAQLGASFTITDMVPGYDELGAFARIVAVFQGTMYNCATGASLPLTEGGLVLEFREF